MAQLVVREVINTLLRQEDVKKDVVKAFNHANVLLSRIKSSQSTYGEMSIFNVQLGYSPSAGSRRENQKLPAPGFAPFKKATIDMVNLYGTAQVSGPALAAAEGAKGPIKSLVSRILDNAKSGLIRDRQRQLWGDGSGKLARVKTAVVAGSSVVVTDPYGRAYDRTKLSGADVTKCFEEGMSLYFDNPTSAKTIAVIQAINVQTGTLVLDRNVTVDAEALIYRGESATEILQTNKDFEIQGVSRVFGSTGDYLGIDRTNLRRWQGGRVTLGDGKLSLRGIRAAKDESAQFGNGGEPDLAICDLTVKALYEELLDGRNRLVNTKKLSGGFTALEHDGTDIVADKDAIPQSMQFFKTADWTRYYHKDIHWLGEKEGNILRLISGYDMYEAGLAVYENVACQAPANQTELANILSI